MVGQVMTGLDVAAKTPRALQHVEGRVGYLCHSASVDANVAPGIVCMQRIFGSRLRALFAPQHGLATDAQDNMIESPDFFHPWYQLPVFSLYADTRVPTPAMLNEIDHLIIDLQDNGARVYTYVWTMVLALEACAKAGVPVTILDRPNPLGGLRVEGNMSQLDFRSIIGWYPFPMRHGMTMAEIALYAQAHWQIPVMLTVVKMLGWQRSQYFEQTGLPWVLPSPNLPSMDTALVYTGTVLFEGSCLSEGRGTTRPFELIGHPQLQVFPFIERAHALFRRQGIEGCALRPAVFTPTFDKFTAESCQGFQLHVTDRQAFRPWRTGQWLLWLLWQQMGDAFSWRQPPFEYVYDRLPVDLLNGSADCRQWVEQSGSAEALTAIEAAGMADFLQLRTEVLLYKD